MDSAAAFSDDGKGCGQFSDCELTGHVRGVCPKGWHLPSAEEFETLFDAVGGIKNAGTPLKSTSGWNDTGNGTDDYGFTALPGGYRNASEYSSLGTSGQFWTSTLGMQNGYLVIEIDFWSGSNAQRVNSYKWYANSVRCVMD